MGRKPRNRNTDAVLMFWMQLSGQDQLNCVLDMMRHLAGIVAAMPDPPRPKKSKIAKRPDPGISNEEFIMRQVQRNIELEKGGKKDQMPPLQA